MKGIVGSLALVSLVGAGMVQDGFAQDAAAGGQSCPVVDYFAHWFDRVSASQAEQPHWITPLVTVTPRLEQEIRYDQFWQSRANNQTFNNFGAGKGLELIPTENTEIIIGMPAYQERSSPKPASGWADENLLLKYRLLSANEDNGNYIVSLFLGAALPTGSQDITTHQTVFTPALAFGKGWGDFDLQGTCGIGIPTGDDYKISTPITANLVAQERMFKYIWPEFEVNYTYWCNGENDGHHQVYLTPGVVVGRIPMWNRLGLTVGAGLQVAVTSGATYHNNAILSARLPF